MVDVLSAARSSELLDIWSFLRIGTRSTRRTLEAVRATRGQGTMLAEVYEELEGQPDDKHARHLRSKRRQNH